jgi:phage portal protein BeeE
MGLLKVAMQGGNNFIGAESFRTRNPGYSMFDHYSSNASSYPSIRAISNEYMAVQPKAVDARGEVVAQHDILNALYHPNQKDSSVAFAEKIAVSTLAHRKTYLLVWRREGVEAKPGGDFTTDTIAGFTFLERPGIERRDGKTYYQIGSQQFNENSVLVLPGGVDPDDLYAGYSPSEASIKWATLDDYIAEFQQGFFKNGAVPAGQFLITAPTVKEYNDTVDMLQARHAGAGKNGNVSYSHRPIDPTSGKPAEAQVEWIPFAQANKDIDFNALLQHVDKRIDVTFGVPAIVKGIDDAATYANAQVAEKTFAKRAVYPLLLRNYTQLTHELNRITNGTGIALTFDYTIPTVADEEKVEEETAHIRDARFQRLVEMGYTIDSISNYFSTGKLTDLKVQTLEVVDNADVDDGSEVDKSPDPEKIDGVTPLNEAAKRTNPKANNLLTKDDTETYEEMLSIKVRAQMSKQIEEAIEELDDNANNKVSNTDVEQFTDEMMQTIIASMIASGTIQYENGIALVIEAGLSVEETTRYVVSAKQEKAYRDYLKNIARSYMEDTGGSIRRVLDRANTDGWNRAELESGLRSIMATDEWRVHRLAVSEINRSQSMSSIYSMQQINSEVEEAIVEKSLEHGEGDAPCEFCVSMIGNWITVDEYMVKKGDTIEGADGGKLVYTWDNNEGHGVHANDHCYPVFRVKRI